MNKNQETKEKICTFFVSDYHFEMLSLPYIDGKLNKGTDVVVLTENDLEKSIDKVLSTINLKDEEKRKIKNINWKNEDISKFRKIKDNSENKKQMVIFIKGKENYIKNINQNIEKWTSESENIEVVDCYDLGEIGGKMKELLKNYNKILKTTGEVEIKN